MFCYVVSRVSGTMITRCLVRVVARRTSSSTIIQHAALTDNLSLQRYIINMIEWFSGVVNAFGGFGEASKVNQRTEKAERG